MNRFDHANISTVNFDTMDDQVFNTDCFNTIGFIKAPYL